MIFLFDGVQGVARAKSDQEAPYLGEAHELMKWAKGSASFSYPVTLEIAYMPVRFPEWGGDGPGHEATGGEIVARATLKGHLCGSKRILHGDSR